MKIVVVACLVIILTGCHKEKDLNTKAVCDVDKALEDNARKVTITNGVWGTVLMIEGNCMPTAPASNSGCRTCPVQRTVRIYSYAKFNDAMSTDPAKVFIDSIATPLIAEVVADTNGFFQASLADGKYTIVSIENGKLYATGRDGDGGINPITVESGNTNANLSLTYNATF